MKILTANIAYGFEGMDRFATSIKHQLHIHGPGVLTYELVPGLRRFWPTVSGSVRITYAKKNKHLGPILDVIRNTTSDILVLNETLYEIYREDIEFELTALGFQTIAWGVGTHYPGTTIATLLATRELAEKIPCTMPQRPSIGGGAGMAGIRMKNYSIFGMHLTYRNPSMFTKQLAYVAQIAKVEQSRGNEVILAGDFNESEAVVCANADFKTLGLISADTQEKRTCPTFFPRFMQKSLDHVFIPARWDRKSSKTIAFGSDHLALCVEVDALNQSQQDEDSLVRTANTFL